MSAGQGGGPVFRASTVIALIVVGVFAFGAFLVFSAYSPDLRSGRDGGAHALSVGATGYSGLARLLEARQGSASVTRDESGTEAAGASLVILTPPLIGSPEDLPEALQPEAANLIIPEKWFTSPHLRRSGWVRRAMAEPSSGDALNAEFEALGVKSPTLSTRKGASEVVLRGVAAPFVGATYRVGRVEQLRTIAGPGLTPLIVDETGRPVLVQVSGAGDEREVYLLSDPDLASNLGMASLPRARFAVAVVDGLRRGDAPALFDVTINGFGRSQSLLKLAFEPPFLAVTVCVLVAAALAGWQGAVRYGPTRRSVRAVAFGKAALADNAAGLIKLAGREARMAPRYAQLVREQVAQALGAPRDLGPEQLTTFLDRLGARRGVDKPLSALEGEALTARDAPGLLRSAQALHHWRLEMTREHR